MPPQNFESMEFLRYSKGQHYRAHQASREGTLSQRNSRDKLDSRLNESSHHTSRRGSILLYVRRFLISKHLPTQIWPTRPLGTYPQQYVKTESETAISVTIVGAEGDCGWSMILSRLDARLLARRITQCLEASK